MRCVICVVVLFLVLLIQFLYWFLCLCHLISRNLKFTNIYHFFILFLCFQMNFEFCKTFFYNFPCLVGYISTAINDGPGCLMLRCPDPSCSAVVCQDMINDLASYEEKEKYSRYFIRSYVEDNRKVIPRLDPWSQWSAICLFSQSKCKTLVLISSYLPNA